MAPRYHDWVGHHARVAPGRTALCDLASGRHLTYAGLHERVSRIAGSLRARYGITKGDRIAALSHNCAELFELMFACARLGAIYLPLNWRLTAAELTYILRDCEPKLLVADLDCDSLAETLLTTGAVPACISVGGGTANSFEGLIGQDVQTVADQLTFDDVQMLMYTSGTTGSPKGALITYGMTFWNAVNVGIPSLITPETRLLSVMPMFHTGGLNLFANPVFHAGGTVILMRGFEPGAMLDALSDPSLAITHTFAVPTAYQAMSRHPKFADARLDALKMACVGGAATPPTVLEEWGRRGVHLANGYGMTETGPAVTLLLPDEAVAHPGSVGRLLLHTEIRVVDAEGRDVGVNEPGELWVRGPNVTPGYWRNETATRSALVQGWLRTGDIVRRDAQGFCFILDRAKDMYISGGENVYPAEVEAVLMSLEGVREVAVIGVPDERWGESGLAIIVSTPGAIVDNPLVLQHCAARLARYKLPRDVVFVDELPRTVTGKIHKPTLRQKFGGQSC
jgi:fatty-acyl-CoA synthase